MSIYLYSTSICSYPYSNINSLTLVVNVYIYIGSYKSCTLEDHLNKKLNKFALQLRTQLASYIYIKNIQRKQMKMRLLV